MSFDIFLQRFEQGAGARADGPAVLAVLEPLITARDGDWAQITTPDGEADVYGVDDPGAGLMVNHASGRRVWDVLFEVAQAGGMAVMPAGCPTCVTDPGVVGELPAGVGPAVVVRSGGEILRLVLNA